MDQYLLRQDLLLYEADMKSGSCYEFRWVVVGVGSGYSTLLANCIIEVWVLAKLLCRRDGFVSVGSPNTQLNKKTYFIYINFLSHSQAVSFPTAPFYLSFSLLSYLSFSSCLVNLYILCYVVSPHPWNLFHSCLRSLRAHIPYDSVTFEF